MRTSAKFLQRNLAKPWVKTSSLFLMASVSLASYGLGLGKLSVNSNLNEPMNAEIKLLNIGATPLSGIKVRIADLNEFSRVGMERSYVLGQLSFDVIRNKKHQPVIKITSKQRIDDPFIQFLLDVAWADGQFYRSYTILLDPPGYITAEEKNKTSAYQVKSSYKRPENRLPKNRVIDRQIDSAIVNSDNDAEEESEKELSPYHAENEGEDNTSQIAVKPEEPSQHETGKQSSANNAQQKSPSQLQQGNTQSEQISKQPKSMIVNPVQKKQTNASFFANVLSISNGLIESKPQPSQQQVKSQKVLGSKEQLASEEELESKGDNKNQLLSNELKVSVAVIQTLKESNELLRQQLKGIQKQNEMLSERVANQDKDMQQLRKQFSDFQIKAQEVLTRASVAGQQSENSNSSLGLGYYLLLATLLFIGLVAAGIGYFYYRQQKEQQPAEFDEPTLQLPGDDDSNGNQNLSSTLEQEINEDDDDVDENELLDDGKNFQDRDDIPVDDKPRFHPAVEEDQDDQSKQKQSQSTIVQTFEAKEQQPCFETDELTKAEIVEASSKPTPEDLDKMVTSHRQQVEQTKQVDKEEYIADSGLIDDGDELSQQATTQDKPKEEEYVLEFESGLSRGLGEEQKDDESKQSKDKTEQETDDNSLDFEPVSVEAIVAESSTDETDAKEEDDSDGDFDDGSDKNDKNTTEDEEYLLDFVNEDYEKTNDEMSIEDETNETEETTKRALSADDFLNDYLADKESSAEKNKLNDAIDNQNDSVETIPQPQLEDKDIKLNLDEKVKSLKSPQALNTLLSLAETYMAMEDWESAKHSLEEVIEYGTEEQQLSAKELLKKLKH